MVKKNRGKVISGVYITDSGQKKVMTRNQFIRTLQHKGGGPGSSNKPVRWRKYRLPRKTSN